MDYQVRLSRSARLDLQNIVRYISINDPARALRFGRFLIRSALTLSQFPKRGRVLPELGDEAIREIIVRAYRIVYHLDHDKRVVEVIRIWHAARGTPDMTPLN